MRLSHPPSRLSPPPGTSVHDLLVTGAREGAASGSGHAAGPSTAASAGAGSGSGSTAAKRKEEERVPKRGYRACVHCRLRKAKCDLGDVNAPSEPPCTRCRREQRNCVFLPSKRRRKAAQDDEPEIYASGTEQSNGGGGSGGGGGGATGFQTQPVPAFTAAGLSSLAGPSHTAGANGGGGLSHGHGHGQGAHTHSVSSHGQLHGNHLAGEWAAPRPQMPGQVDLHHSGGHHAPSDSTHGLASYPAGASGPSTGASGASGGGGWSSDNIGLFDHKPSPLFDPPSTKTVSSIGSVSTESPNHQGRRRRNPSEPDATRRIVVASFNNETDALEILANAATDADGDAGAEKGDESAAARNKRVAWDDERPRSVADFVLIKRGVLDEERLEQLVEIFFQHHHPVLPIVQTVRIPHTKEQLASLSFTDPFLLSSIVCVASHHHPDPGMKEIHERTYALIRETIADYTTSGLQPSIGFVEGVLILAENLPAERLSPKFADMAGPTRETHGLGLHGTENRRAWALTGTAIRAAYGLGLDRLALEDGEQNMDLERARGVWTWCYLYDRTLGLRTGLAFWSRGPAICFSGYSSISQTGEAAAAVHFPYMMNPTSATPGEPPTLVDVNESASMMQAHLELTQIMTNAHDILFSTPSRTSALVRKGEYFKFLEHFKRALDSFTLTWKDKTWRVDSVRELTWCTYHFVRLYVSAFAFQAHVQRAQERAEQEREPRSGAVSMFPRGSATSPDALFIYDSIDSAHEILHICIRLAQSGVLRYLPSRYLINFAYSGTFALKAAYSGAVGKGDAAKTIELVDRVCAALILASPDKDHPACRYGQMLRLLSKRLSELSDASAVPSRFPSPEPSMAPDMPVLPLQMSSLSALASEQIARESGDGVGGSGMGHDPGTTNGGPALFDLTQVPANLFDVDVDVGFNLDGFWDDFTLTDSGGFPFR
ncbi:hypothetical protein Q8F55_001182 [Vanrija albida]|uniref:Zn(2)-C6 fungal-type domain-containing protein n=1 Tax=Vanrija albida TaxID=181172 RepID=A0ABR3QGE1_9TREE